ncbi:hypothetical protein PVAP13_8NG038101 [Panicum virgatum]|uniref:Uncharacterized protein n=1 Tax=Panicum virgatum TaxID=38727 RepID=A0A8T0P1N8_PANVG|nr:hypothetical protein PVAP13_8NG038101 [Panicum virgatum]
MCRRARGRASCARAARRIYRRRAGLSRRRVGSVREQPAASCSGSSERRRAEEHRQGRPQDPSRAGQQRAAEARAREACGQAWCAGPAAALRGLEGLARAGQWLRGSIEGAAGAAWVSSSEKKEVLVARCCCWSSAGERRKMRCCSCGLRQERKEKKEVLQLCKEGLWKREKGLQSQL